MNEKEINAKRVAEVHKYLFPELSEEIKKIYDGLIKRIDELEQENDYWEQTHNNDIRMIDRTKGNSVKLFRENRQLEDKLKQKYEVIDEAIKYLMNHYVVDEPIKFKNDMLDILQKYKGDNK